MTDEDCQLDAGRGLSGGERDLYAETSMMDPLLLTPRGKFQVKYGLRKCAIKGVRPIGADLKERARSYEYDWMLRITLILDHHYQENVSQCFVDWFIFLVFFIVAMVVRKKPIRWSPADVAKPVFNTRDEPIEFPMDGSKDQLLVYRGLDGDLVAMAKSRAFDISRISNGLGDILAMVGLEKIKSVDK